MRLDSLLEKLLHGKSLLETESQFFFTELLSGRISDQKARAFLLLLARKGESAEEILGCVYGIQKIEKLRPLAHGRVLDTCGTGGDRSGSLNISTLAALIIAGAGGKVAKHGNRSVSSRCGSSDFLEALGVNLDASAKQMQDSLEKYGIAYFHAPLYHPLLKKMQPIRRSIRLRTIFNVLGPLLNPAAPSYQLTGVASFADFKTMSTVLARLKRKYAWVVMSREGMDELSPGCHNFVAQISEGRIQFQDFDPKTLGFKKRKVVAFKAGTPKQNAALARKILKKPKPGALRDILILNAAAGIHILGLAKSLKAAVPLAQKSLDSGAAYRALEGLILESRKKR